MKPRMKLPAVFVIIIASVAFSICNKAFANNSFICAQRGQGTSIQAAPPKGIPPKEAPPEIPKQAQPGTGQYPQIPPPAPRPEEPPPFPLPPVVPPPGMTMCLFINNLNVQMAIVVPAGSTCHTNPDGSVTVTFPDRHTFTVPYTTQAGIFYVPNTRDPIIIVPYINSTILADPDLGWQITLPDGSVYVLPESKKEVLWFFPPTPLPLQSAVVNPANTVMCAFTNDSGVVMAIILPLGSSCTTNSDGSVTIRFADNETYTIPYNATTGSIITALGWHILVVPYYGTSFTQFGPLGYYITLPDGSTRWEPFVFQSPWPPQQYATPPMPSGLGISSDKASLWIYPSGGSPFWTGYFQAVGNVTAIFRQNNGTTIIFSDGHSYFIPGPLHAGAYSHDFWIDPDGIGGQPGHWVTYHFAVIYQGSTVTSLGHGWYHVHAPPGYGPDFDFRYP